MVGTSAGGYKIIQSCFPLSYLLVLVDTSRWEDSNTHHLETTVCLYIVMWRVIYFILLSKLYSGSETDGGKYVNYMAIR